MTMETVINVKCDGENCDKVRSKDTNHWLIGVSFNDKLVIALNRECIKWVDVEDIPLAQNEQIKDFCGQECAVKWVSRILTEMRNAS